MLAVVHDFRPGDVRDVLLDEEELFLLLRPVDDVRHWNSWLVLWLRADRVGEVPAAIIGELVV